MPRIQTFDEQDALTRAVEAFWQQGYNETSYDDLVKATGVSRYGLYNAFGEKRELFLKALEQYIEENQKETAALMGDAPSLPEIKAMFRHRVNRVDTQAKKTGCFMCNTAMEMAPTDPECAAIIEGALLGLNALLIKALGNAKDRGEISAGADPEALASHLVTTMFGAANLARTEAGEPIARRSMEAALEMLDRA